jgi:hypothetical protein
MRFYLVGITFLLGPGAGQTNRRNELEDRYRRGPQASYIWLMAGRIP